MGDPRGRPQGVPPLARRTVRAVFWFLALSLLFNSLFGDMGLVERFRQKRVLAKLSREVASLRAENARLVTDIDDLRRDPYRIEAIAREELGLVKPGEIVFLFGGRETPAPSPSPSPQELPAPAD
jgi:cell division protein FtsB